VGVAEEDPAPGDFVEIGRLNKVTDLSGARCPAGFRVDTGMAPPVVCKKEKDIRRRGLQGHHGYATQQDDEDSVHSGEGLGCWDGSSSEYINPPMKEKFRLKTVEDVRTGDARSTL
jgi:hypothetical protein